MSIEISQVTGYDSVVRRRGLTKWVNLYLNERLAAVEDIVELQDCLVTAKLLEALSRRELIVPRSERKSSRKRRSGWKNIASFLESEDFPREISEYDIDKLCKGSVDAISALVWRLVEHYLITPSQEIMLGKTQSSAREFLLKWVRQKLPQRDIKNFDYDWRDGTAICDLVNALKPGLIPEKLFANKLNHEDNAKLGLQIAHDAFGIPQIISPFDIAGSHIDELSILTYIALFCKYENLMKSADRNNNKSKLKLTSPLSAKEEIACKAYGSGLKTGELGKVAEFTVELNGAKPTDVTIAIECKPSKGGFDEKPELSVKPLGRSTYAVKYLPSNPGDYVVSVLHCGAHILRSPFYLTVAEPRELNGNLTNSDLLLHGSLPSQPSLAGSHDNVQIKSPTHQKPSPPVQSPVDNHHMEKPSEQVYISGLPMNTAEGPGLVTGEVGRVGNFTVITDNNTKGPLSVCISCPAVSIPVPYVKSDKRNSYTAHKVVYVPTEPGAYEIFIKWGENGIRGSPFKVFINDVNQTEMEASIGSSSLGQVLGGKGKIRVYYSATSTNPKVRRDNEMLRLFLQDKGVCSRQDYGPWVTLDVGMPRQKREEIFKRARTRKTPMLFVNDEYIGSYEDLFIMDKQGLFERCLNY